MNDSFLTLAPMAGYTDSAFRQICKDFGVDWLYSEMISADGIVACKNKESKIFEAAEFSDKERPISIQLVGNDPKIMAEAVSIVIDRFKPDGIDINMGCPARKVFHNDRGAALLKDPDLACEIISIVKGAVGNLELSAKTRLGIESPDELAPFVPDMFNAGISHLTIHARIYKDRFSGGPRLEELKKTVEAAKKMGGRVIGNGGVVDIKTAKEMLKTGVDGLAIGRGSVGNPWIFKSIKEGKEYKPSMAERIEVVEKHAELAWENQKERGILEMRKHLGSYFKGLHGIKKYRIRLVTVNNLEEIKAILKEISLQFL